MLNLLRYFHKSYFQNKAKLYTLLLILIGVLLLTNLINSALASRELVELKIDSQIYHITLSELTSFYYLNNLTSLAIPTFELLYIGAFLFAHFYRQNQIYACLSQSYERKIVFASLYLYASLLTSILIIIYALIYVISNAIVQLQFANLDYYIILLNACFEIIVFNLLFIGLLLLLVIILRGNYISLLIGAFVYLLAFGWPQTEQSNNSIVTHLGLNNKLPFSSIFNLIRYDSNIMHATVKTVNNGFFWSIFDYLVILCYLVLILYWAYDKFQKQDI